MSAQKPVDLNALRAIADRLNSLDSCIFAQIVMDGIKELLEHRARDVAVERLIAAADEKDRLRPLFLATIPGGSEACTSPERDAYFAACARFDAALAAVHAQS